MPISSSVLLSFFNLTFSDQNPNITVALDGTGDVRSIGETVQVAPNNSNFIYRIYNNKSNNCGFNNQDSATFGQSQCLKERSKIDGSLKEYDKFDTEIMIYNCTIIPLLDLAKKPDVKAYLGRSWKKFSQTIIYNRILCKWIY
ncbi:hypothetical protein EZV62_006456 [Acer yangbiense]|uniref:Pectinesterase catalytic domain-containing protein n=1 Tax=Acer yangbiense TaxID=1000413 RepID=A0A5C7I7N5_9ROSI|nr:hypothetical protein EZV62_006456 [Acer yangbiense]